MGRLLYRREALTLESQKPDIAVHISVTPALLKKKVRDGGEETREFPRS